MWDIRQNNHDNLIILFTRGLFKDTHSITLGWRYISVEVAQFAARETTDYLPAQRTGMGKVCSGYDVSTIFPKLVFGGARNIRN